MSTSISRRKEIAGFTWLKAILPIFVILVHYREVWTNLALTVEAEQYHPTWQDILFMNVIALAVPLFFIMSLYLYLDKRLQQPAGSLGYLWSRIKYLGMLFIIWRIVYALLGIGSIWPHGRGVVRNLYHWLLGGGDTPLYFLEILILLLLVQECMIRISEHIGKKYTTVCCAILLAGSCCLLAGCYFLPYPANVEALRHFSLVAFLPYCPAAWLLLENKADKPNYSVDIMLLVIGIVLAGIEWHCIPSALYLQNGYSFAMPSYARLSTVVFSVVCIRLALRVNGSIGLAKTGAALSLYVYCLHQVFITITIKLTKTYIRFAIILLATYATAYLLQVLLGKLRGNGNMAKPLNAKPSSTM